MFLFIDIQKTFNSPIVKFHNYNNDQNGCLIEESVYELENRLINNNLKFVNNYTKEISLMYSVDTYLTVANGQAYAILEIIKDNILKWALELKKQGILGDDQDMDFTKEDKEKAKNITINFNGDINNSPFATGSDSTLSANYNANK